LFQVIDVELPRLFPELLPHAAGPECLRGEEPLQLLRERRLRHVAAADPEQLDVARERGILAIVQGPDDVVRGGEALVTIELPAPCGACRGPARRTRRSSGLRTSPACRCRRTSTTPGRTAPRIAASESPRH